MDVKLAKQNILLLFFLKKKNFFLAIVDHKRCELH